MAVPLAASALIDGLQWRSAMQVLAAGVLVLGLGAVSLILELGAITVLWWRRQQLEFYRERYEAEIERREAGRLGLGAG